MIDSYAIIAIAFRASALTLLGYVLYRQAKLIKPRTQLQWLKNLLMVFVFIMLTNQLVAIFDNFFRNVDGNLETPVRHFALIMNSISGFIAALILAIIYQQDNN